MLRVNGAGPAKHVLEVVTPRTNVARLSAAEHMFGALVPGSGHAPASLEIVGDSERRRFLVRTTSAAELRRISGQLAAAYPQAVLRPFDAATFPNGDPARVGPDEQVAAATLQLRAGEYLPLRTFDDRELDGAGSSVQVDPLLGVLGALGDLPGGWRAIAQLLVLAPAPADWASAYQRRRWYGRWKTSEAHMPAHHLRGRSPSSGSSGCTFWFRASALPGRAVTGSEHSGSSVEHLRSRLPALWPYAGSGDGRSSIRGSSRSNSVATRGRPSSALASLPRPSAIHRRDSIGQQPRTGRFRWRPAMGWSRALSDRRRRISES
jgi:hypothetical protein